MARGDAKIDVRVIIRAHRASYVDARDDRPRIRDYLLMEGVPIVVLVLCLVFGAALRSGAAAALLTVTALLSALFFGLMIQTADRAMNWADDPPAPGPGTSAHAIALRDLSAHAGYAALVCIAAAIAYVIATVTAASYPIANAATNAAGNAGGPGWWLRASSSLGIALGVHLVFVLLMVMKRVFMLTQNRLDQARTGGAASPRRRAS